MKKLIILSALALGVMQGFSQNKTFVSLATGSSIPLGNFASSSPNNPDAGLAKAGMHFDLSGSYKITKHFGLTGLLRYQFNSFNEDAFRSAINPEGSPFPINLGIESKPWKSYTYMIGLNGIVPLNKKLSWESKAMLGLSTVKSPDYKVTMNIMGVSGEVSATGKPSTYGSLLLGTGIRYQLKERWHLTAQADYWLTETEVKSTITSSDGTTESSSGQYMNLSTLNIGIGVGYSF